MMNPATEIDSSQQCHSAKQAASIPETTWYIQQQREVADYTCSPDATLLTCLDLLRSRAIYYCRCQPRPSSRGGVGHTWPVPHLDFTLDFDVKQKMNVKKNLLTNLSFTSDIFWWSQDFGTHWDYFGWADSQSNRCDKRSTLFGQICLWIYTIYSTENFGDGMQENLRWSCENSPELKSEYLVGTTLN